MKHGDPLPIDESVFFGPDPELALVTADLAAWHDAHPCSCDEDREYDEFGRERRVS